MTWNLNERDAALATFVKHVASRSNRGERFAAALQECREDAAAIVDMVKREGGSTIYAMGNGTMSILCSEPLDDMLPPRDAVGQRLLLTKATLAGRRFAIVNYHGNADGQAGALDHFERGGCASEARWRIDNHSQGAPVIMIGDFNADPGSSEITSRYCFSFASQPSPSSLMSHGRERDKLCVAPPRLPTGIEGTYRSASGG